MSYIHISDRRLSVGRRVAVLASVVLVAAALSLVASEPADARPRCWRGMTCDRTAPDTSITSGPSGTVTSSSAAFEFTATEAAYFQCRFDAGSWVWCASPASYSGLSAAAHLFEVRATDTSGNVDASPATRSFTVSTATTPTTIPPIGGTKAATRPVGSPALSDAEAAARVTRSSWEPRPANYTANHTIPTATQLATFRSQNTTPAWYRDRVTGNFTGTTDEIIQWAAHKWGIDEDLVRAQAVKESWWTQSTLGDGGISFGLMQIKSTYQLGTTPQSQTSTSFNLDYYGALMRHYFDGGAAWLNDPCCFTGTTYGAGDIWGAAGVWYSGRWYDPGAVDYINAVKSHLSARTWAQAGF